MGNDIIDDIEDQDKPVIYSKTSIVIASFFSPIFGAIMYSSNLRKLELNKYILGTIITFIIATVLINRVFSDIIYYKLVIIFLVNILSGFLIITSFWKFHIGNKKYSTKFAWVPLLFFTSITLFFIVVPIVKS